MMMVNSEGVLRETPEEEERKERLNSPMVGEVEMAIDKLINNRAAGPDDIQAEFIKFGKPILPNTLQQAIHKVWTTEKNARGMGTRHSLSRTQKRRLIKFAKYCI